MIEVRGLTKRYGGAVAVDRLSFDVPPGRSARAHLAALAAGNAIRQSPLPTERDLEDAVAKPPTDQ